MKTIILICLLLLVFSSEVAGMVKFKDSPATEAPATRKKAKVRLIPRYYFDQPIWAWPDVLYWLETGPSYPTTAKRM